MIDADSGSRILQLRRKILLLFGEKIYWPVSSTIRKRASLRSIRP